VQVTSESLLLHYYSSRPGLWPIVVGVLKGISKSYFGFDMGIELLQSRDQGADHEVSAVGFDMGIQLLQKQGPGGRPRGERCCPWPLLGCCSRSSG
jgi:hypothetical protein